MSARAIQNKFYIAGIKVVLGDTGVKIFTKDKKASDLIYQYLINEGFAISEGFVQPTN